MRKLAGVVLMAFLVAGCGASTSHYIVKNENTSEVTFNVDITKEFVQSISNIGGGQVAMVLIVGPFTNNAVLLEAKTLTSTGEQTAFRQRLNWGTNKFTTYLTKNTDYKLAVVVQGTREGLKQVGEIKIGQDMTQNVNIVLHGDQMTIN